MKDFILVIIVIIDAIVIGFNLQLLDILKNKDKYQYLRKEEE